MRIRSTGPTPGLAAAALLLAAVSNAEAGRRHEAHVHGHARLDLAVQDDQVLATLTAPGADLVGFEHHPQNDAQAGSVRKAVELLSDGATILGIPAAAACTQQSVDVTSEMLPDDDDAGNAHPDEEQAHKSHGAEEHAEFRVTYTLRCARPDKLDRLSPSYFDAFPRAVELAVQAVGPWGQTSRTLTRASQRFLF